MKELIEWLRSMEELASEFYRDSAAAFAEEEAFSSFFKQLAEDEAWHFHLMGSAMELFAREGEFPASSIVLDDEVKQKIEEPLRECSARLTAGEANKEDVLKCLVDSEQSEWNDVFLYVIRTCQNYSWTFQKIASFVDKHKKNIDLWTQALPESLKAHLGIAALPRLWKPRYLVVEDDDMLREVFQKILSRDGEVVAVSSGKEGLNQVREKYFDVILSDQNMPERTGIDFYREAKKADPDLKQHFILCSGNPTPEIDEFCRKNDITFIKKPVSVTQLRETVRSMVQKK